MNDQTTNMSDEELVQKLAALDWEIEPEKDLWPDISSKIRFADRAKASKRSRSWAPFAIAASSVLAVVSILFSSMSMQYARESQRTQEAMVMYQQAQLSLIDEQHQMVRTQFVQLLAQEQENLNPAFVTEIQQVMEDVDNAAEQIKEAIKTQPSNPDYPSMLVNTYQHELKLLNRVKSRNGLSI